MILYDTPLSGEILVGGTNLVLYHQWHATSFPHRSVMLLSTQQLQVITQDARIVYGCPIDSNSLLWKLDISDLIEDDV